jgi:hypothetical protein
MIDMYQKIAARAYEIWEQEGRPANKAGEHWLRAEREIADARGLATKDTKDTKDCGRLRATIVPKPR